jgi:uncharacterized membrane protein
MDGKTHRTDAAHLDHAMQRERAPVVATPVQAPMVSSGGGSIKPQGLDLEGPQLAQEVPEYLAGGRRDGWRMPLAIGAMLALLTILVWQSIGSWESVSELFDAKSIAKNSSTISGTTKENSVMPADSAAIDEQPIGAAKNFATPELDRSKAAAKPDAETPKVTSDSSKAVTLPSHVEAPQSVDSPPGPEPATVPSSAASKPSSTDAITWSPVNASERKAVLIARSAADSGTVITRLKPLEAIPTGTEIVVPPSMRTSLDLSGRVLWTVCGPSLLREKSADKLTIQTTLCRALAASGPHGNELSLETPTGRVDIKFADATSMAAIELSYRPAAKEIVGDPRAFLPVLAIVAVEGQLQVHHSNQIDSEPIALDIGQGFALINAVPRLFHLGEIPAWYRSSVDRPLDEKAAADFHELLMDTSDVDRALTAACIHRRPETASLAIQTSFLMGDWSGFTGKFLGNEAMRSHWQKTLPIAEQVIASDKMMGERLQNTWKAAYPTRAKLLFSLLVGVPENQQPTQYLLTLVNLLDSSNLDERVLAAHQLRRLTGKDLGYQPGLPNRAVIQQWRRELNSGKVVVPVVNDPLWEAKP